MFITNLKLKTSSLRFIRTGRMSIRFDNGLATQENNAKTVVTFCILIGAGKNQHHRFPTEFPPTSNGWEKQRHERIFRNLPCELTKTCSCWTTKLWAKSCLTKCVFRAFNVVAGQSRGHSNNFTPLGSSIYSNALYFIIWTSGQLSGLRSEASAEVP